MFDRSDIAKSPAGPAAVLLYGIVFLFAFAYFVDTPWRQAYTIALYSGVSIWAAIVVFHRFRKSRPSPNLIDILAGAFLASILISVLLNWWDGTIQYLKLMPVLFVAPYVLGRAMLKQDGYFLRNILIATGIGVILLIFPEYLRVLKHGLPYIGSPAPVLFGQGHGVMLSGLLLSVTLLGLVSVLLSPNGSHSPLFLTSVNGRYCGYALLMIAIVVMGWISSRGAALAGIIGVSTLMVLAPKSARRRKVEILLVITLSVAVAVVHSKHSTHASANAAYYFQVLERPPLLESDDFESLTDDGKGLFASVYRLLPTTPNPRWKGSILGNRACELIVDSISDRWVHYQQAFALFLAKPVLGVGANNYGFYACTRPGSFPHSTLLQVVAELGIIAGIGYCGLIGMTFFTFLRSRRRIAAAAEDEPIWAWLVAFTIMQVLIAQLNGNYFVSASLYFAMGMAANVLDREAKNLKAH